MAVICPMYDPYDGWYIINKAGKKQFLSSLLYYYYSLGVSPPVGAKITHSDILDFEADLEYDNLSQAPIYLENFMAKLSSLSQDVNQIPSTSLIDPYIPMALPNYQVDPSSSIGYQPLSHNAYPNQSSLMTGSHNSSYLSTMLPLLLPTSKFAESEEMETLDYEDEFEEDSEEDCSSDKSSSK